MSKTPYMTIERWATLAGVSAEAIARGPDGIRQSGGSGRTANSRLVEFRGETLTVGDLAKRLGVPWIVCKRHFESGRIEELASRA